MDPDSKVPRILQQQQPERDSDPEQQEQQQQGSADFQSQSRPEGQAEGRVEGEGSYTAAREYQKDIKEYLDKADVQADAEKARPRSEDEARDLEQAEREGRSHSKGDR